MSATAIMSETVVLPATFDAAVAALGSLGALISASKWERAAIVATFVRLDFGHGGRRETSTFGGFTSASEFAELGIIGLRSATSVARYVKAWTDHHRSQPRPGGTVTLPTIPFPSSNAPPATRRSPGPRPPRQHDEVRDVMTTYERELTNPELRLWCLENVSETKRTDVAAMAERIAWSMTMLAASLREAGEGDEREF